VSLGGAVVARLDRDEQLAHLALADREDDRRRASIPEEARGECWWRVLQDGKSIAGDGGGGIALSPKVMR